MSSQSYSEKLRNPRWQKRRLQILQRDDFSCQQCGDRESTLHVHHRRYVPGWAPWEYLEEDLVALCEDCHKKERAWGEAMLWVEETLQRKGCFTADLVVLSRVLFAIPDLRDFIEEQKEELRRRGYLQ